MFHSIKSRFPNCSIFKETCKDHEFIPSGENIVMNCVSGGALNLYLTKKKMFGLFSTSCMDRFMLALVMRNGTLVLQTTFQ